MSITFISLFPVKSILRGFIGALGNEPGKRHKSRASKYILHPSVTSIIATANLG